MAFEGYRLLSQIGTGRDGSSYRALKELDQTLVELRDLSAAKTDPEKWRCLTRRLRLASIVKHPGAVELRILKLEDESPYLVLDWTGDREPARAISHVKEHLDVMRQALVWTGALTTAHRAGLIHGSLGIGPSLGLDPLHERLDFTGMDAGHRVHHTERDVGADELSDLSDRPPEVVAGQIPDASSDVHGLGTLLTRLCQTNRPPLDRLIREMRALDPSERPSAREVDARLGAMLAAIRAEPTLEGHPHSADSAGDPRNVQDASAETMLQPSPVVANMVANILPPKTLGRFRLLESLGEGGQGIVYRAEDPIDGSVVAIKMLRADRSGRPETLRRFRKEARLMAEVNNPFVVNLLEFNEESDVPYLVLELVEGQSLKELLDHRRRLDERTALSIMVEVACGLMEPHSRGIIHRDIKPANILFLGPHPDQELEDGFRLRGETGNLLIDAGETLDQSNRPDASATQTVSTSNRLHAPVKISDFGLARHVVDSESLAVTEAGSIMGTPQYMAPEQCSSQRVDSRTDVYAMGATLFHMLAGRPPFEADALEKLLAMHCHEPAPSLDRLNPLLSEGICRVVAKALAKAPDDRYHDAEAIHRDLERLLRGEPTEVTIHPVIPPCNPDEIVSLEFHWDLKASPRELWPYISNTERVNRALGITAPRFVTRYEPSRGVERFASFRKYINFSWQEHPFEWIEGRQFGVLREFSEGLFHWFHSLVELEPAPGGGTRLTHRIRVRPKGRLGRAMAHFELGRKGGRNLDRVYRRIDSAITGQLGHQPWLDPFETPHELTTVQRRRLDKILDRLVERGVDLFLAEQLGEFVARAPAQEVARIRPLALAKRLDLDPDPIVAACLLGAAEGMLTLHWDLICPICQVSSEVKDTLKAIRDHGHCAACNLEFAIDFAASVEMIFRVHPNIRGVETGIFCIGGPAHSPHVSAQFRVAAGERIELDLTLGEGAYRLRGPQLPWSVEFRVQSTAPGRRWDFDLSRGPTQDQPRVLKTGDQVFTIKNDGDVELVVRIERQVAREDALTAAQASTIASFRELFPGETLSPGQLVSVANLCLLVVGLEPAAIDELYRKLGDARAFAIMQTHGQWMEVAISQCGGAVIRPIDDGMLAAFNDPADATRVALELVARRLDPGPKVQFIASPAARAAVHRGPVLAATTEDRLDYFGATVRQATARLLPLAKGGEAILSHAVISDPAVAELLADRGIEGKVLEIGDQESNQIAVIISA